MPQHNAPRPPRPPRPPRVPPSSVRPAPTVSPANRVKGTPKPPPNPPRTPGQNDWGEVADWYDQLVGESGSEYHRQVVLPRTLRLLGATPGQKVLDVACGQGVLCRLLATRGVATTGLDAAAELIQIARERNAALAANSNDFSSGTATSATPQVPIPSYRTADAREMGFLDEASFDAAACVLGLQNMHPIAPVCAGVARALRPGGRLVVVVMHPCFRGPKETSWGWEGSAVQYRRVDRYLLPRKAPIVAHPGKKADSTYTWSYHKPIEAYVKALRSAGLLVDAIEEWPSHKQSGPGPRQAAENTARKEIPMFMALRAIKVAGLPEADADPLA